MGIVNASPDSFSGDGLQTELAAVTQARRFIEAGADLVDVGGESTRPGSEGVSAEEELRRVIPVVTALAARGGPPISVDTSKPEIARAAVAAGAGLINDVWGLRQPGMLEVAAETGAAVCIMHMQGQPRDMQHCPHYEDVMAEVRSFLEERMRAAVAAGVAEAQIILDPGFGFGKTVAHNLELVRRLPELCALGRPVLLGASRKRTIGEITGRPLEARLAGSVAMHTLGVANGASVIRAHDVAATADMVRVVAAVRGRDWQAAPVQQREGGAE
jgi:dihydropteroate synthase